MTSVFPESRCGSASQGGSSQGNSFCRFFTWVPDDMEELWEGTAVLGLLAYPFPSFWKSLHDPVQIFVGHSCLRSHPLGISA